MANKSRKAKGAASRTKRSAGSQQRRVGRLAERVIAAARQTAYMIVKAHDGDESNIPDENALVEAVEALDKAEGKTCNIE